MSTHLLILEVSQKQAYIFGSKRLKDNIKRSEEIAYVTSSAYFDTTAGRYYDESKNLIYAGGGHTVLRFEDRTSATDFAKCVTEHAMRDFPGLELFVKCIPYDEKKPVGENLDKLTAELERKKNLRSSAFHQGSFGGVWKRKDIEDDRTLPKTQELQCEYTFTNDIGKLAGQDNFVAVVHIDGNAMGDRVRKIYENVGNDLDHACEKLQEFSAAIDTAFQGACQKLVDELSRRKRNGDLKELEFDEEILPFRRVVAAGDDICFVTAGKLGLFCAEYFLKALSEYNTENGNDDHYAACAGVVMVHTKYPFHQAYQLSEELCSEAKRFGASLDASGRISAMDWHMEFGQLCGSLSDIRRNYQTEDGNDLNLRPVVVLGDDSGAEPWRRLSTVKKLIQSMNTLEKRKHVPRSKLKELRTPLAQGKEETAFALQNMQIRVLEDIIHPAKLDWSLRGTMDDMRAGKTPIKDAFVPCQDADEAGKKKHCLLFDPIELMDHVMFFEEGDAE